RTAAAAANAPPALTGTRWPRSGTARSAPTRACRRTGHGPATPAASSPAPGPRHRGRSPASGSSTPPAHPGTARSPPPHHRRRGRATRPDTLWRHGAGHAVKGTGTWPGSGGTRQRARYVRISEERVTPYRGAGFLGTGSGVAGLGARPADRRTQEGALA